MDTELEKTDSKKADESAAEDTTEDQKEETKKSSESWKGIINSETLINQAEKEYDLAWKHQSPKKQEALKRLKLLNNQKRDKNAVGDTTMFSIFQTVLASLYSDRLMVDFRGKEDGDEETADNLNALAKSDYDDMEKDKIDYDWDWDTCFFGWGLVLLEEFDRDADNGVFLPIPENIDAVTWLRDPAAKSVNGGRKGKGAMRFGGREIKLTREEMENHPSFFSNINFTDLKYGAGTYSLLSDAASARDDARGNQSTTKDTEADLGDNAQYTITEWFTHTKVNEKIAKVKIWLANDRKTLVGLKVFKRNYWPIVFRQLYPHSNEWDGTSIPDLTEDKQRQRAVAQNLGLKGMKADLEPMYIYDTNKIKNKADLDFDFNKGIGIDAAPGEPVGNSVQPLIKARPNLQLLQFIYESLDASAQKATATPDIKMGIQSQANRPLGETNLLSTNSDTRYSLGAKIFGWSDKDFWTQWYNQYKDNFTEDIDEKVLRTVGAFGSKWRGLSKKDIITKRDPDIYIESTNVSRAKDLEERNVLAPFYQNALAEPTANRRYIWKDWAKLNGMTKDKIDRMFPPTIDERIAEKQNEMLNKNELVPVLPEDDHNVHLEIHAMARDTDAAKAHITTHIKALSIKKTKPELFPPDQQSTMMNTKEQGGGAVQALANPMRTPNITPSMTSGQR